jgi:hypothetical protein
VKPVQLNAARVDEAAEMLTRASQNDPFQSYIFPDPEERRSLSPPFFSRAGDSWGFSSRFLGSDFDFGPKSWKPTTKGILPFVIEYPGPNL